MTNYRTPELPTLEPGVTLLETESRTSGALHSLVLDHVLLESGSALWVDARGNGTTQPIAELAPDMRVLDRIRIARAFTPWQHYSLLEDVPSELTAETTLLVLPDVDAFYRNEDLSPHKAGQMFSEAFQHVVDIAETYELPVLVTRMDDDTFSVPVENASTTILQCEQTTFGPRFSGEEFETLVYPVGDGIVQTTFTFWRRVLASRHPAFDVATESPTPAEVRTVGSN
ncbi:hypothetical protein NDI76_20850 [Halogeometricum sp. S1BR25-6]|uniref:DNA recombination and repair protein Rad51-like C-terminal domain-containing protein n=1 Tax=Halogeometricum salsisoli TaxID=2950536 RepID=A0ABU2GLL3_9EURY|nr:hypothetical protein [Halogeometricum sp. S1BR25-6]MDS0301189.1 hypothetical protein [Halogeometricum sp. S1BR25-6]